MKALFIILARGGSKGLPNKNIKLLLDKPLIAYSIESAMASKYCSRLIVSTDDSKIQEISISFGADVPFTRPAELSSDTASSIDAILHCVNFCEERDEKYDLIVLLEPTSPLRDSVDVDKAIDEFLNDSNSLSCISIAKSESAHPRFLFKMEESGYLSSFLGGGNSVRRQELTALYYPEGSFYIIDTESLKMHKTFFIDNYVRGFELPKWKSFEIDTEEDFIIVESLLKSKFEGKFKKFQ